jgi:hypothetical protein
MNKIMTKIRGKILNMIIAAKGGDIDFAEEMADLMVEEVMDARIQAKAEAYKEVASIFGIDYVENFGFFVPEDYKKKKKFLNKFSKK